MRGRLFGNEVSAKAEQWLRSAPRNSAEHTLRLFHRLSRRDDCRFGQRAVPRDEVRLVLVIVARLPSRIGAGTA